MKILELLRAYAADEEPQDNPRFSVGHLAMPLVFAGLLVVLSGCMAPSAVQRHDVNVMWKDEAPAKVEQTFPAVIHSEEPTPAFRIEGPAEAAVGELVELVARGDSQGWAWHSYGGHRFATADGNSRLFFSTAKPGSYEFALGAFDGKAPVIVSHKLIIGGVPPQPTPEPEPQPTPIPVPPPQPSPAIKCLFIVIEESGKRTPAQGEAYHQLYSLKAKGHMYRIIDRDDKAAVAAYANQLTGRELPVILLFNGETKAFVKRMDFAEFASYVAHLKGL